MTLNKSDCNIKLSQQNINNTIGWVRIKSIDRNKFIYMVPPIKIDDIDNNINNNITINKKFNDTLHYQWMVKTSNFDDDEISLYDHRYHFIVEKEGYIINRAVMGCLNIFSNDNYQIKGHSIKSNSNIFGIPADREFSSQLSLQFIDESAIISSKKEEDTINNEIKLLNEKAIAQIALFPSSQINSTKYGNRVISYGLYGNNKKYTNGALKNVELSLLYYPGWKCRIYYTSDVPINIVNKLKTYSHVELISIPNGEGYSAGMFYRFLVAIDPTIDRYIIRDVDSRLNARERFAVEEWILASDPLLKDQIKFPKIHIMRDHINHCNVMNGGMWGGIKNAIPADIIENFMSFSKDSYLADMNFLKSEIWPLIKDEQLSHDSYCCDQFPHTIPFPSKRYLDYQHVGQVFNAYDEPRLSDIDDFIRGLPTPSMCRKKTDWIYG